MGISKKNLMKRGKKRLNAKLERHITGPHALLHEVSDIYIYIYWFLCFLRPIYNIHFFYNIYILPKYYYALNLNFLNSYFIYKKNYHRISFWILSRIDLLI